MAKRRTKITARQQHWLDHIKAADASKGSLVAYAAAHDLKQRPNAKLLNSALKLSCA